MRRGAVAEHVSSQRMAQSAGDTVLHSPGTPEGSPAEFRLNSRSAESGANKVTTASIAECQGDSAMHQWMPTHVLNVPAVFRALEVTMLRV